MQKNKIAIAKKTLNILESKQWKRVSINEIIGKKNNIDLNNKIDFLININRYFDYSLRENLTSIEKSSPKDMLFEVFMARLDILNIHRKSTKNIIRYLLTHPQKSLKLLPSFIESIILIATLSDIDVEGIQGVVKIKAIFILYIVIIFTWYNDETVSLEKTMTTLDKYLTNIDKFISLK